MANLDDLGITSITDQSTDDALERIRQIRLARRTNTYKPKPVSKSKPKPVSVNALSDADREELLKILGDMK